MLRCRIFSVLARVMEPTSGTHSIRDNWVFGGCTDETKQSRSSKAGVSSLGTSVRAALECGPDKGLANEQRDLQLVAYRGRLDCLRRELVVSE